MRFGLSENVILKINNVFSLYPEIDKVVIYGSRAIGNYKKGSDIDLTIFGTDKLTESFGKIKMQIDDLNTPYLFDISIFNTIENENLTNHINRVGQVFFKR